MNSPFKLRPYQQECLERIKHSFGSSNKALAVLATGCVDSATQLRLNNKGNGKQRAIGKEFLLSQNPRRSNSGLKIRGLRPDLKSVGLVKYSKIVSSGKKECVELSSRKRKLVLTPDHLVWTEFGWCKAQDMLGKRWAVDSPHAVSRRRKRRKAYDTCITNLRYHPYARVINVSARGKEKRIEKHRGIFEASLNKISFEQYKEILRKDSKKARKLKFIDPQKYHIHHIDGDHYNNELSNLQCLPAADHLKIHAEKTKNNFSQGNIKWETVSRVNRVGTRDVYDVVGSETESFTANDVVVHNSGKTVIITHIDTVALRPIRVLYLVHKIPLVHQIVGMLKARGRSVGIYCGSLQNYNVTANDIVATVQSISRLLVPPVFDLVVVDETHRATPIYYKLIRRIEQKNHNLKILGVTATPYKSASYIYGQKDSYWPEPCYVKDIASLTREGHLVRAHLKGGSFMADVSRAKVVGGDYVASDLEEDAFSGKIPFQVDEALRLAQGRRKIVWSCISILHAERVADELRSRGELVSICTSADPLDERELQLGAFTGGDARHLVFVSIVSEGFDYPPIDCVVLLRATKSPVLYVQTVGRALRLFEGKKDALVLDYGRVVQTLGPLTSPTVLRNGFKKSEKNAPPKERVIHCQSCFTFYFLAPGMYGPCPECGTEPEEMRMRKAVIAQLRKADASSSLYGVEIEGVSWFAIASYTYELSPNAVVFEFVLDASCPIRVYRHEIKTPSIASKYDMGKVRSAKVFLRDWFGIKQQSLELMIKDLAHATQRPDLVGLSSETLQFRSFSRRSDQGGFII